ncbi:unnamed protein product [Cuscuta europaea]|uniref:RNase H type-1 domain-containing protein n=1 Tax=Cuscuta europaea TaxID=41803 RepID=A0A9P1EDK1_CUSEU|nr:unnamed protein product [Cuscuta europaea]
MNLEFQTRRKAALEKMIWCERNHRVWQGAMSIAQQLFHRAGALVDGWSRAQAIQRNKVQQEFSPATVWCRPTTGKLKLNVDAAVRPNTCGLSWCFRDENGSFIAGAARPWLGILSPLSAELVGIQETLSWVKQNGCTEMEVETDAA